MKIVYFLLLITSLPTILTSCNDTSIINENKNIENRTWLNTFKPKFSFYIHDTSKKYTIYLYVRHTSQYDFSNLAILLREQHLNSKILTFSKNITLARADGSWKGKSAGNLYVNKSLIHEHYFFPDTGLYQITIQQNMPENPLKEITDIGLQIVPE